MFLSSLSFKLPVIYKGATNPIAAAHALIENAGDPSAASLSQLERRRRELAAERKAVTRAIKNEARKRRRLLAKTEGLSDDALFNVVAMRAVAKAKAKGKAKAAARASASG